MSLSNRDRVKLFGNPWGLTSAEQRVMTELCKGDTLEATAKALNVKFSTIVSHIRVTCQRMGCDTKRARVLWAQYIAMRDAEAGALKLIRDIRDQLQSPAPKIFLIREKIDNFMKDKT